MWPLRLSAPAESRAHFLVTHLQQVVHCLLSTETRAAATLRPVARARGAGLSEGEEVWTPRRRQSLLPDRALEGKAESEALEKSSSFARTSRARFCSERSGENPLQDVL